MMDLTHAKLTVKTGVVCGNPIIKQPEKSAGHGWSWQDVMAGFFFSADSLRSLTDSVQLDHTPMDLQEGHQVQGVGEPWEVVGFQMVKKNALKTLCPMTLRSLRGQRIHNFFRSIESGCVQKKNTVRLLNRRFSHNSVVRWESWARHWWKGPRCLWKGRSAKAG